MFLMDNPQDISRVCNLDFWDQGPSLFCLSSSTVEESCLLAHSYNLINGRSLGESAELASL